VVGHLGEGVTSGLSRRSLPLAAPPCRQPADCVRVPIANRRIVLMTQALDRLMNGWLNE